MEMERTVQTKTQQIKEITGETEQMFELRNLRNKRKKKSLDLGKVHLNRTGQTYHMG